MPNTTQFPNRLLDELMQAVTPAVWKLVSAVVRQTYGYQKQWDAISKSQMVKLTGLSEQGVNETVAILLESGLLKRGAMKKGEKGQEIGFLYSLNVKGSDWDRVLRVLGRKDRPYVQKVPRRKKIKVWANSVGERSPIGLGVNLVGEGSPTESDIRPNSVGTQNQFTKPNIKTKGERPLTPSVALIAQKQFLKAIGTEPSTALASFGSSSNPRHGLWEKVRCAASDAGLTFATAKAILADHPKWTRWDDLPLLDSQREICFPEPLVLKLPPSIEQSRGRLFWASVVESANGFRALLSSMKAIGVVNHVLYVEAPNQESKTNDPELTEFFTNQIDGSPIKAIKLLTREEMQVEFAK
jgi:phage replication O-like protein O